MAPKRALSASQSTMEIGNCEVTIEANKFAYIADPNSLQISIPRSTKIKIAVREGLKSSNDICQSKSKEKGEEYTFVLVNPKDAEDSCSKSYLQEVLKIYSRELPTMNYAANTGKQSMFLEKCVLNGKYCTLLLKFKSVKGYEVAAAITYQIVPADTQYAEVPLAAVSSIYQHKGLGQLLYMELRKRLQSVGTRTIFCWGDKESEGFWHKQGFVSIAEVDTKGRARRLPVKADIRKALCFPGGSTLMVSHLKKDTSADTADPPNFYFPLKPCEKSSLTVNRSAGPQRFVRDGCSSEEIKSVDFSQSLDPTHNFGDPAAFEKVQHSNMTMGAPHIGADTDAKHCSCSTQGEKRKVWEATLSSLKSKKVKGSHCADCVLDSNQGLASEGNETMGLSGCKPLVEISPNNPVTSNCMRNDAMEDRPFDMTSAALVSKELQSSGGCFRIMLMNIADDSKKLHLSKVIENLGGAVSSDGSTCTHVVTGKVRKTLNFCTALCSGAWIVSPSWLKESFREGRFVDESSYILHDNDYVLKYRSELKDAVLRAKARPGGLLKGYNISMAAYVEPPVRTLSVIVRSAGANVISSGLEKVKETSKTIFIACEEEMEEALSAIKKGVWTFSSEWLMNCIMKQELDLEAPQFAESL